MNNTELDYTTGTPWLDCDLDGNVTEATEVSLKDAAEYTELTDYGRIKKESLTELAGKMLKKLQGNVPILEMLEKDGFPKADRYLVAYPDFVAKLNELYTEENLPLIRDFMIVSSALKMAG